MSTADDQCARPTRRVPTPAQWMSAGRRRRPQVWAWRLGCREAARPSRWRCEQPDSVRARRPARRGAAAPIRSGARRLRPKHRTARGRSPSLRAPRRPRPRRRRGRGARSMSRFRQHTITETDLDLKLLLKRGALLAAANWPIIAIQFVAETAFQVLLAVPIIGAAILVAVMLGADLADLLQGSLRDMFTTIASTLLSEPVALVAFIAAFAVVLFGGSVLMFAVKGGTVEVLATANAEARAIERQP